MKCALLLSIVITSLSASQPPWKPKLVKSPGLRDVHDPSSFLDVDPLRGEIVISYYDYVRLRVRRAMLYSFESRDSRVHGSKRRPNVHENMQDPEILFPSSPRHVESDMSDEERPAAVTHKKPKLSGG